MKKNGYDILSDDFDKIYESTLAELTEQNLNLKYLIQLQRCMKSIKLFRIGMRLNRPDLMKAGVTEFSKLYFLNCNIPYTTIYCSDEYQYLCLSDLQKKDIESRECFLKDPLNLTTGESADYVFENENKVLKQIIGPNPTMDDFTVATLVIEDVKKLNNKVHELYPTRSNPTREAGFPNIDGCVKDVRIVIRKFLDVKPGEFKNLDDIELNKDLLMYQEEANNRRRIFLRKS